MASAALERGTEPCGFPRRLLIDIASLTGKVLIALKCCLSMNEERGLQRSLGKHHAFSNAVLRECFVFVYFMLGKVVQFAIEMAISLRASF